MSSHSMTTTTASSSSISTSSLPRLAKGPIYSSGRGGSGNKRPKSVLKLDLGDEAEILEKRRLEATLNPRVKVKYTGRGGTGNIRAASVAQSIPFDISADPDDDYERIVLQGAQKAKQQKTPSTGRGGLGNSSQSRAKSFSAATGASKGKKEKPRRRRSATSSRFSTLTTSSNDYYELQSITTDTGRLSFNISAPPGTPASAPSSTSFGITSKYRSSQSSSMQSSLPTPPPSSPSAPYLSAARASTTSISISSIRSISSGLSLLPVVASSGTRSAPSSPLRLNAHNASSLSLLPPKPSNPTMSAPNSPLRPNAQGSLSLPSQPSRLPDTPAPQPRLAELPTSLSSLPNRSSTSSLGLLSPPASPTTPEPSPIPAVLKSCPTLAAPVADPNRNLTPQKLHKARSHDASSSKWWKIRSRRRAREGTMSQQDVVAPEDSAMSSSSTEVSPVAMTVPLHSATPEEKTLAQLQEVGMHAMEVRMRMREERLLIIRNAQRYPLSQPQETDEDAENSVEDNDASTESERIDTFPLPSVPEEDGEYVSFLDFD